MLRLTVIRLFLLTPILSCLSFQSALAERSQPLVGNGHHRRRPVVGGGPLYQTPKRIRIPTHSQSPKRTSPVRKPRAKLIRRRSSKAWRRPKPIRGKTRQRSPYRRAAQKARKRLWRKPFRKFYDRPRKVYKRRYRPQIPRKIYAKRHRLRRKIRTKPAIPKKKQSFVKPRPIAKIFTKLIKPVEQSMVFPLLLPHPITRAFGWSGQPRSRDRTFHSGIDIDAPLDMPVVAAYRGTVITAGIEASYGLSVVLSHRQGAFLTRYSKCSTLFTQAGRHVNQGQIICEVGNSGGEEKPHLHFELLVRQVDGKYVAQDPVYRTNVARVRLTQRLHLARTRSKQP